MIGACDISNLYDLKRQKKETIVHNVLLGIGEHELLRDCVVLGIICFPEKYIFRWRTTDVDRNDHTTTNYH